MEVPLENERGAGACRPGFEGFSAM
jgi:hypothetical protein